MASKEATSVGGRIHSGEPCTVHASFSGEEPRALGPFTSRAVRLMPLRAKPDPLLQTGPVAS